MPDLLDGETAQVQGSAREPYVLRNVGGVYSCTCPAWRNQSIAIERRSCKHLRRYRGAAAEETRVGQVQTAAPVASAGSGATAPPLLLAEAWDNHLDLAGWWMSEKLDGVRAYWDGKQFLSRQGNLYHAPDWFVEHLPATPLDGELWLDRKAFQRTVSIVRRQDKSDHWQEIKFLVFDAPAQAANFEDRLDYLRACLAKCRAKHVQLHRQDPCRDLAHLRQELARVEALGGEGLMLREPGSRYFAGRSSTLLKVKTFHDAEARVVDHQAGAGRHRGRLGALAVELPDGTRFSVGTGFSDAQRENPPPIGSLITFRYQELSDRGVPRFPSFVRLHTLASASPTAPPKQSQAAKPKASVAVASVASATRHFELVEGAVAKFWKISLSGNDVTVRFGRVGANGQTQTKSFETSAAAQQHADKLIREKKTKGYVEQP